MCVYKRQWRLPLPWPHAFARALCLTSLSWAPAVSVPGGGPRLGPSLLIYIYLLFIICRVFLV
ncbi:hypothetical protein LX32DRAFT_183821 [Colletotrichum zoysiae]|uniref:Uncharacterized protein n=1 Tax=Colletotrichum zoysiae TaxID=1216348 RepID=A0AAD9H6N5_9PEZI|nr:hypothetical protein LX32DRAFT_183821 [Colletotrichum zoysiae]